MKNKVITNERREFLKKAGIFIGVGLTATSVSSLLTSCEKNQYIVMPPPVTYNLKLADYPGLATIGSTVNVKFTYNKFDYNLLITKLDATKYSVLDPICTHAGCQVGPVSGKDELVCPCHHVAFSTIDGKVIKDPIAGTWTPKPLTSYTSTFDAGNNILKLNI